MLNKVVRVGILVLLLTLGNALSFSPLSVLAMGLSYAAFIILRYVPSLPTLLRRLFYFYHKWILKGKYK